MWPLSSGIAWMTRLPFISQKPGQTWRPSVTNRKRQYGGTWSRSKSRPFSDQWRLMSGGSEGLYDSTNQNPARVRRAGSWEPLLLEGGNETASIATQACQLWDR
jgi:hypothetical protein